MGDIGKIRKYKGIKINNYVFMSFIARLKCIFK